LVCGAAALLALGCSGSDDKPADTGNEPPPETTTDVCADAPEFKLNMEAVGREKAVKGVLIDASPAPPVRKTNDWVVEFRDLDDELLTDVSITMVQPFMPEHGHDGTFAPSVMPAAEAGQFQIDDINLWMPGKWEVRFTVESESAGADYVVFEACIPE
jgi:hypothetical protein